MSDRPAAAVVGMLGVLNVADDRVQMPVADLLLREPRHQVGPDADGLGDLHGRRILERRRNRTGDESALGDDLVAACAVLSKELQSRGERPALGMRRRNGGARAERRHVGDESADLLIREQDLVTPRLLVRIVERHVAGAQVEVRGERAHALQRGPEAFLVAGALNRREHAFAVAPVAARAVRSEELPPVLDERCPRRDAHVRDSRARRVGGGRRCQRERGNEDGEPLHSGLHVEFAIAAMPLIRMALMKRRFPSMAAKEKKWRRPAGGGSSYSSSRVDRKTLTAATSATTATRPPTTMSAT